MTRKVPKEPRDKGYRKVTMKFRRILNHGHFVDYPLHSSVEVENEPQVRLWRAVIDQHLKDIISHHLVERNFYHYYEARKFIDDQLNGNGAECDLAYLDAELTKDVYVMVERTCRELRERGIIL